jgi:DNA-binding NtrC family response regulator
MSDKPRILVVDDEAVIRDSLEGWFTEDGYVVGLAEDAKAALARIRDASWDLVLLDIKMPGMDGLELQRRITEVAPGLLVIMMTAYATVDSAVQALKAGAYDYVTKPFDPDELAHMVRKALEHRAAIAENAELRRRVEEIAQLDEIIGKSPAMTQVLELVRTVAESDSTVLIRGESGTGKELVARAIHANSERRMMPIVPVHCGAVPDGLMESELFGHEKGAFTGAQYRRKGKFEMADGGTIFLDEIGDVSPRTQVDLLRVLQDREFTRVGGNRPIKSDFRVIAATNRNLEEMIEKETFRQDLYYRLNVFTIHIPPVRERPEDIPPLAEHFLRQFSTSMSKRFEWFSPEALELLQRHDWPGNVREIENAVERAVVVGRPPEIRAEDLPGLAPSLPESTSSLADVERRHVRRVLDRNEWNITRSAKVLGIDRVTLYNKIKKYDLKR